MCGFAPRAATKITGEMMRLLRRRFLNLAAAGIVFPAMSKNARAQAFPSRPVTMIVPFAAGGPADVFSRIVADRMQKSLGQSVIIENVAGAAGTIGAGRVAHATPDGYTLLIGPGLSTNVINPAIYRLDYDPATDLAPIGLICFVPNMMVGKKDIPADDLKGLVGWLKANPDKALQGTSGVGSLGHLAGVLFQKATGTSYQFVPYRGLGPALQDLVAGRVDLMIDVPVNPLAYVRDGKLKAFAILGEQRVSLAPEVPTADEAGVSGLHLENWYSIFAPKGTPSDIVAKLNVAVVATLSDPASRDHLAQLGFVAVPREQQSPQALAALQKSEIAKWMPIVKAAGIKPE
jgi:tripartite-type tricarboxylate transporter receptor subunit TctC